MQRRLSDGAVEIVHWSAVLTENGASASAYGSVTLSTADPEDFIPYDELTQEEVINWVFEALGPDRVVSIQEGLYDQVQNELNPQDALGLPW